MKLRSLWLGAFLLAATVARAQTDVLVSHYDAARTGQNLNEPTLTVPNLGAATFGKVYAFALDGYTYAQPLYKSNLTLPGLGTFNVVFAATEHGTLYAIDADSATPLWQRSFINPATGLTTRTTNPSLEDLVPEVSITSTPVIDATSGTLYVVAETLQNGSPALYWLHALDLTTGADKLPPVAIQASVGNGATPFHIDAPTSLQRPGLFLSNGVVYIGFGSSGDSFPWVGWLVGYNATTLAQVSVFCTSGAGAQGAGLWSSGEAPAVDANGNIFVSTGNGYFSAGSNSWADTFLKLSTTAGLAVADYFAPFNASALGNADLDVASAGLTLLPDAAGSAAHPHLMVGSGKDGEIYLIDRDNMGHFNGSYNRPQNSNIVQWLPGQIGTVTVDPTAVPMFYVANSYTTPAYWQNHVYFCGVADACKAFTLANGLLSTTAASQAPTSFGYPGSQPIISAASSAATSAVMWAVQSDSVNNLSTLHAYDATNLANEVYNSNQAAGGRDHGGRPVRFAVPTVANGKVFIGAQYELDVYGMLGITGARLAAPVFTPGAGSYPVPQAVTITAAAGATIHYTLDGSPATLASPLYTQPLVISSATTVNAIAVQAGAFTSPAASAGYTFAPTQIAFVQGTYATPQSPQTSVSVRYASMQSSGDLNVVIVGWGDSTATVKSVTDTSGNTYLLAVGPTLVSGALSQSIYYAKNITAPGANTVSVAFSAAAIYPDVRILEYRGIDPASPLDVVAAAVGNDAAPNSGAATTSAANELIIGADLTTGATVAAGSGFTSRMITVPDADIAEDRIVTSVGSYAASASAPGGPWVMQMATFKSGGAGTPASPSAPATLTATAAGVTVINLAWGAATETGGAIAQYLIERCQGSGCSNFAPIGTASAPNTSSADSGLTGSTSYSYRVRAKDSAGTTGPYSNIATTSTAAATPSAPASLAASASGSTQINLTWSAATETGGTIAQYLIERCQGSGCSSFAQVGTATALAFSDSGLTGSTTYSYRVRAKDAAGSTGPYSNVATATTAAAAPTISAPAALAATAASATQISLTWGAATETGGTLSQYLIERCQGSGCSNFAQVGTTTVPTTTFVDSGLAGSTSYSYRVRAKDPAANTGPYSNVATATTGTVAPTISAPGALAASATSASQVSLTWGAATETGGTLSQYLIERCQGAGCSNFTQVGTTTVPATAFVDTGLAGSTSYSYRVRATDGAGNTGPYSNTATSVTLAGTPSAPLGLAASAAGSTQVNLSWAAATESGGTIAQYLIERCQGAGCSSFAQVGTATALTFSDTTLGGSTTYSYRVRAKDAAGNTGPYSNTATTTTAAPTLTAPGALSAGSVSSTQINLAWGAATETGGTVSQYRMERCQGAGCSTFTQVATASGTAYNDAGLSAATAYSYRVRAADAAGNTGPYSNVASATTASGGGTPGPITFVQYGYAVPQTPQSSVSVRFSAAQVAGDLNVIVVGWGDTTAAVGAITDSSGNVYRLAVGPTGVSGTASQSIYYAANIVGAAAGANSVTVSFTAPAIYPDIRIAEYGGIDPNNPLDVVASGTGNSATSVTPPVTTTYANDLLVGANLVQSLTTGGGSGFSTRVITFPDGDILEDRVVSSTGSYSASAPIAAAPWIMQLAAFRRHP